MSENIPQDAILTYPSNKYRYIPVYFIEKEGSLLPIDSSNTSDYSDVKKCYFIFKFSNWFFKNHIRGKSDFFSEDTYKQEFSYYLFKLGIVENLLFGLIDEENNFIDILGEEEKEKINIKILDYAVTKYIESFIQKKLFNIDLDQLSKDVHNYFRYGMKVEAGKPTGFIRPHTPSAVILKNLLDQFPGTKIEDLMEMDEALLQMMQVVGEQQQISGFERQHVNENILQSKNMEKIQENAGGPGPQIHSMNRNPKPTHKVPLYDATTFSKK